MRWPPTFCLRYEPFFDQKGLLDGLNVKDDPVGKGGDDDKSDDAQYTYIYSNM